MTFNEFLLSLVSGTTVVPVIKMLIDKGWLKNTQFNKNVTSFLLPLLIAILGYMGLVYFNVMPAPNGVDGWFEAMWPVFSGAYATGQLVYKYFKGEFINSLKAKK